MGTCWAEPLGGCSDKISREHTLTAGLFLDESVRVKGFPWCKDECKEISVASLTRKNLCRHHNSLLHLTDDAAIAAANIFRKEFRLGRAREAMKSRRWSIVHSEIDGSLLERWFLKTLINVAYGREYKIGRDSENPGLPSVRLVRIAFGTTKFEPNAGLYGLGYLNQQLTLHDGFRLITLVDGERTVVGCKFEFQGYEFLLFLEENGLSRHLTFPAYENEPERITETLYRMEGIRSVVGKHLSHVIHFRYENQK